MKLESLENKSSIYAAEEARDLIRKMYRHILNDNCDHCRHILRGTKNND